MKRGKIFVLIILTLFLITTGCKKEKTGTSSSSEVTGGNTVGSSESSAVTSSDIRKESPVIAKVNGTELTQLELDREIENLIYQLANNVPPEKIDQLRPMLKKHALDNLINKTLFLQKAEMEGIKPEKEKVDDKFAEIVSKFPNREEFQNRLTTAGLTEEDLRSDIKKNLQVEALLEERANELKEPTEDEIDNFYKDNQNEFKVNEEIRASHILISVKPEDTEDVRAEKRKKIENLKQELANGADFAELAKTNSDCPSKLKGGDLGFFGKDKMVPAFEKAAFDLKVGEISDVVETQFGYHIIKLTDQKAPSTMPLDEMRENIKQHLKEQNQQKIIQDYITDLRSGANIEYTEGTN